ILASLQKDEDLAFVINGISCPEQPNNLHCPHAAIRGSHCDVSTHADAEFVCEARAKNDAVGIGGKGIEGASDEMLLDGGDPFHQIWDYAVDGSPEIFAGESDDGLT